MLRGSQLLGVVNFPDDLHTIRLHLHQMLLESSLQTEEESRNFDLLVRLDHRNTPHDRSLSVGVRRAPLSRQRRPDVNVPSGSGPHSKLVEDLCQTRQRGTSRPAYNPRHSRLACSIVCTHCLAFGDQLDTRLRGKILPFTFLVNTHLTLPDLLSMVGEFRGWRFPFSGQDPGTVDHPVGQTESVKDEGSTGAQPLEDSTESGYDDLLFCSAS